MKRRTTEKSSPASPRLIGLVLAGGKSTRMGHDKGLIEWHGKAQRYYVSDLLAKHCDQVIISCRDDQVDDIVEAGYKALPDSGKVTGQYGAILTAMEAYPNSAILVVACDLPLINSQTIAHLVVHRDSHKLATAYKNSGGLAEPLMAVWEPTAHGMLLRELAGGITCPRKALIKNQSEVKLINPSFAEEIMNVNTPEAADIVQKTLNDASYVSR